MREDFVPVIPYMAKILMYVCNKMVVPRDYRCILLCALKTPFFQDIQCKMKWNQAFLTDSNHVKIVSWKF